MCVSVSGTTGPAIGRCAGPVALAFGACGLEPAGTGSATGMLLLPTMRSISLDVMGELTRTELRKIDAIAGPQSASLS